MNLFINHHQWTSKLLQLYELLMIKDTIGWTITFWTFWGLYAIASAVLGPKCVAKKWTGMQSSTKIEWERRKNDGGTLACYSLQAFPLDACKVCYHWLRIIECVFQSKNSSQNYCTFPMLFMGTNWLHFIANENSSKQKNWWSVIRWDGKNREVVLAQQNDISVPYLFTLQKSTFTTHFSQNNVVL